MSYELRPADVLEWLQDKAALSAYWRFFTANREAIRTQLRNGENIETELAVIAPDSSLGDILEHAVREGSWEELLGVFSERGTRLASEGASLLGWLRTVFAFREAIRELLTMAAKDDPENAQLAATGLYRLVDVAITCVADAFLRSKEARIMRVQDLHRAMFEHSPLPMWMYERETLRFIAANAAALHHYGYSREELSTMTLADIRAFEHVETLQADVGRAVAATERRISRHRKRDGTTILVEVIDDDLTLESGEEVRLALLNDVTGRERAAEKLRRTEEQLHQAQKIDAIGRLAAGVAHDFNNLLTVITSYAVLLEEALGENESARDDAIEIRHASEQATTITRQLLTLGRHSELDARAIDLDDVIAGYLVLLRRLIGERVTLELHRGATRRIVADPNRVEQILLNLAVNARDAMPEGGRLTVQTEVVELAPEDAGALQLSPGAYVVIAVSDTGLGMDAATRARIFEPFFTTKEPGRGTGLGLSIVHGIVSQIGGAVSVYSEPGKGSTFRVFWPVAADAAPISPVPVADPPRTLPNVRVLVVDDYTEVRAVAIRVLRDAGCEVLEAASAPEALRLCTVHDGAIEVLLTDVVLGEHDGTLLARRVRELRPGITVVLMSGCPRNASSRDEQAPGHLLAKPFTPAALRTAIARALAESRTSADHERTTRSPPVKIRVLVADDDGVMCQTVARALQRAGHDVMTVTDGTAAICALTEQAFDAVVSDVQMPGLTGLDVLREVRRVDLDVPIILMSGSPDVSTAATAVEYGAFRYLTKPLDIAALPKIVAHAARVHALARIRRQALQTTGGTPGAADRAGRWSCPSRGTASVRG